MLLTACAPGLPTEGEAPPRREAPPDQARLYRVDPAASELRLLVYREGPLAAFGHNHVIVHRALDGSLWLGEDPHAARFLLGVPVTAFEVDPPALREEEGEDFPGELDADAVAGTRANMLGAELLDADAHPMIELTGRSVAGELPDLRLTVDVSIAGQQRSIEVPARLRVRGDTVEAAGEFTLRQTELGLQPFSVMLGALRVQDEVRIKYRILARGS